MATLYKHTGEVVTVEPANGKAFTLAECYTLLGCDMIQVLRGFKGREIMVIDEEAKCKDGWQERWNTRATILTREHKIGLQPGDMIVGHALVCKGKELK
jgi:hypothetical protein